MPDPRIHIEFASGSSMAAILRRGPSEWTRLLLWDTSNDRVTPGAWFRGRIYEESCSISPDGQLFAYLAAKHHGNHGGDLCHSWIAISRPPWLTAIAFWPQQGTQGLAAEFVNNSTLMISHPHWCKLTPKDELPKGFKIVSKFTGKNPPPQTLPKACKSSAWFDIDHGTDQQMNYFEYQAGKLMRNGETISDLGAMSPDPVQSPPWAHGWPKIG